MINPNCFEVNLVRGATAAVDMVNLGIFAIKNAVPALVVDPSFCEIVLMDRLRLGAQLHYRVICTVDFENGTNFALQKMRSLPKGALGADGFEFLLSPARADKEAFNELKSLYEFVRNSLDPTKEIRWCFGLRSRTYEQMSPFLPYLQMFPGAMLRTDHSMTTAGIPVETHLQDIEFLRRQSAALIKVSDGSISLNALEALRPKVARFDVTLSQAQRLVQQIKAREEALQGQQ